MPKYTEKELKEITSKCSNYTEILRHFELGISGGNHSTLKKWIKTWGIDIGHFETASDRGRRLLSLGNKFSVEEILVENSSYSRSSLKKRLYKANLKKKICELCGQGEDWHGKKIVHIIDHINGVNNDNRIENLRIICPNCDSTLDTFCGRNKPKPAKPKNRDFSYRHKVKRPPLEQLLREIDESSYVAVGKKYGVTDNAIRKWLKCPV